MTTQIFISILYKDGGRYATLHCPGRVTSRNSYLGIGREMPPVGHLSCKQTKRKVRIHQRPRGIESWLHSLSWKTASSSFHTTPAEKAVFFDESPSLTSPHHTVCSLLCELLGDKHNILFWNLRCPALGLTNSKSSLRSSMQIHSHSRAFALAERGKSCPVSSLY